MEQYTSNLPQNYHILNNIKAIAVDSAGNIWVGTYDGLFYILSIVPLINC